MDIRTSTARSTGAARRAPSPWSFVWPRRTLFVAVVRFVAFRGTPLLRLAARSGDRDLAGDLIRSQVVLWGGVVLILVISEWLPSGARQWLLIPLVFVIVGFVTLMIQAGRNERRRRLQSTSKTS